MSVSAISFAPLLPWPWLAAAGVAVVALLVWSLARRARGGVLRGLALAGLLLALADPRLVEEVRSPRKDVAVLVVDESPSQQTADRPQATRRAEAAVREALARYDDLEVVTLRPAGVDGETRLFAPLARSLADIPQDRFAGAVMITDGQVHDAPPAALPGPLHVLLTGEATETDRRIEVTEAPAYGIVGETVAVRYRLAGGGRGPVTVTRRRNGTVVDRKTMRPGETGLFPVPVERAGPVVVELQAAPAANELSTANNTATATVNGVRDRLRVLLVSGKPHPGERTWRNLLKSDPLVDLVHFTILRPPEKSDFTPIDELALIPFPVRRLFEERLTDFDLVVFDRYVVRNVLTPGYMDNLVAWVKDGGGLLLASGPEFAGPRSLARTRLADILPARPTGGVVAEGFRPGLAPLAPRHPVADLPSPGGWGRWFRRIEARPGRGTPLLQGPDGAPLLVLDRVGDGRVAQLLSDHLWLWARGFDGGGPQAELVRRLAHWLMKEPDLEEEALTAEAADGRLTLTRRTLAGEAPSVTVTRPDGSRTTVDLTRRGPGRFSATLPADAPGLYRADDGRHRALAAVGNLDRPEDADLRSTAEILRPPVAASGGGLFRLAEGMPTIGRAGPDAPAAGPDWLGLRRNGAYAVTGLDRTPILPGFLLLALVLAPLAAAWWREGR